MFVGLAFECSVCLCMFDDLIAIDLLLFSVWVGFLVCLAIDLLFVCVG